MGCGASDEGSTASSKATAPRAERPRVADPRSPASKPAAVTRSAATASASSSSLAVTIASPPTSTPHRDKDAQGRTFQGTQLGTQEFQSKSYTERKHLEELEFKKALKAAESAPTKPREPSLKEREQEIVASAGGAMFDLSLLTERPDEEELGEKRRVYEDTLQDVQVSGKEAQSTPKLSEPRAVEAPSVGAASSALRSALDTMRVAPVQDALVEDFPPLP